MEGLSPLGRTPPGVRELKLQIFPMLIDLLSRTPPGVRELKHLICVVHSLTCLVAPLPGCVN